MKIEFNELREEYENNNDAAIKTKYAYVVVKYSRQAHPINIVKICNFCQFVGEVFLIVFKKALCRKKPII